MFCVHHSWQFLSYRCDQSILGAVEEKWCKVGGLVTSGLAREKQHRGGYNDFEFILIPAMWWGPVTHLAADKGIDHDDRAHTCNLFSSQPKLECDHDIVISKSLGWAALFGGLQGEFLPRYGAKQYVESVPKQPTSKKCCHQANPVVISIPLTQKP